MNVKNCTNCEKFVGDDVCTFCTFKVNMYSDVILPVNWRNRGLLKVSVEKRCRIHVRLPDIVANIETWLTIRDGEMVRTRYLMTRLQLWQSFRGEAVGVSYNSRANHKGNQL